jgi:hypothetical protein
VPPECAGRHPDEALEGAVEGRFGLVAQPAVLTERDGRTLWTATMLYPSRQVRDAALNLQPAWKGAAEGYVRLAALLEEIT